MYFGSTIMTFALPYGAFIAAASRCTTSSAPGTQVRG